MNPMATRLSIDLEGLTFGRLYRFVDLARSSGVDGDTAVTIESTDGLGNDIGAHALSGELGEGLLNESPVLVERDRVDAYVKSLSRELRQESDATDRPILKHLLDTLEGQTSRALGGLSRSTSRSD